MFYCTQSAKKDGHSVEIKVTSWGKDARTGFRRSWRSTGWRAVSGRGEAAVKLIGVCVAQRCQEPDCLGDLQVRLQDWSVGQREEVARGEATSWVWTVSLKIIKGYRLGFPGGSDGKASARNVGDLGLIPGLQRSPGGGNGNPLQYSCLKNPMDRGAW